MSVRQIGMVVRRTKLPLFKFQSTLTRARIGVEAELSHDYGLDFRLLLE